MIHSKRMRNIELALKKQADSVILIVKLSESQRIKAFETQNSIGSLIRQLCKSES